MFQMRKSLQFLLKAMAEKSGGSLKKKWDGDRSKLVDKLHVPIPISKLKGG